MNTSTIISNSADNHGDSAKSQSPRDMEPSTAKVKDGRLKGNLSMFIAKTFSGINENALKFLLPHYMNAYSGVVLRLGFGSIFFWILGWIKKDKKEIIRWRDRWLLLLTGVVFVFGFMYTLLIGLTYTTPISSSIFICLQGTVVYIITVIIGTDRLSWGRVFGIILGVAGALVCILTQKQSDVASNPLLGNLCCLASTLLYAGYLVIEKIFLKRLSNATVSKYTFSGGAIAGIAFILITGKWFAPVVGMSVISLPFLVLAFILLFPTSLSYLLTDIGLKLLPATVVALYSNWILIVAAIASYILGQDHFSWLQLTSMLLIIAGVWFVESAERSDHSKPRLHSLKKAN